MRVAFQKKEIKMSKLVKLLIIFTLYSAASVSYSQNWISTYTSSTSNDLISEDKAYSIEVSNSGYVYVTGFCSTDSNGTDIFTIKYDAEGDTVWTTFYNGTANSEDKAYAIVVDDEDNIYITGYVTNDITGKDIIVIKYNSNGDRLWVKLYNGNSNGEDIASAIVLDRYGNVCIAGYTSTENRGKDIIVIKYESSGYLRWFSTYNNYGVNADDMAYDLATDRYGNVYAAGSSMASSCAGSEDMITIKFSSWSGYNYWTRRQDGGIQSEDKAYAIVVDDYDNIVVTGYSTRSTTFKDVTTIKYSSYGSLIWINTKDNAGFDDYANCIAVTVGNGIVVAGTTQTSALAASKDYIVIKYSSSGVIEWTKTYQGVCTDIAYELVVSEFDNAVYVTGSSMSDTSAGSEDMFTIELDLETGDLLDTARFDGLAGGEDVAVDIAIDSEGDIYLTGYTEPLNGSDNLSQASDFMTVKFTGGNLVNRRKSPETPYIFSLSQNYPNPFNPTTTISFTLPQKELAVLKIYDIQGRVASVLINQILPKGEYSVKFKDDNLASGVYFYELSFGNYRDVKKMILIK